MEAIVKSSRRKKQFYIVAGVIISFIWIALFLIGLLVDSDYYRVAINYDFYDLKDIIVTFLSFTLSNVALLAFFSGLLGGITSRLVSTKGFKISQDELENKGVHHSLIENPFISAIRGIIIFIGLLSIQYATSFTELTAAPKESEPKKEQISKSEKPLVIDSVLIKAPKDSTSIIIPKSSILSVWKNPITDTVEDRSNEFYVHEVLRLKDSLEYTNSVYEKNKIKLQIKSIRRKILPPTDTDFGGISLQSYFKFAIIASLLAFIMGYDPRQFERFMNKLPVSKKDEKNPNEDLK